MTCDRCGSEKIGITGIDRNKRINSQGKKVFSPNHDLRKCYCKECFRVFYMTSELTVAFEFNKSDLKTYVVPVGKPSISEPLEQNRLPFDEDAE